MTADVEQQLAQIKKQVIQAQQDRMRQEAKAEQLLARRDELMARLKSEFGCDTVAQAKAKLEAADTEHAARLEQIRIALKEVM